MLGRRPAKLKVTMKLYTGMLSNKTSKLSLNMRQPAFCYADNTDVGQPVLCSLMSTFVVCRIYESHHEKTCPVFLTRFDTKQPVQPQKMVIGL